MAERHVFRLFASCRLTAGSNRALIADTQRGCYYTIPLALYYLLKDRQGNSIDEVLHIYPDQEDKEIINSYFDFLLRHELIFICPEHLAQYFPAIADDFDVPAQIANAIIALNHVDEHNVSHILAQLVQLNCLAIEVVLTPNVNAEALHLLLHLGDQFEIDELHLLTSYSAVPDPGLLAGYSCLCSLTVYLAPEQKKFQKDQLPFQLSYATGDLSDHRYCGVIQEKYFTPNLEHYTEALQHNTCLNRKISIDAAGNIKNCPSMKESFGNIRDTTLAEALHKPGFKKYWNITKDQISICKDCEFRYVCTDCRAYLEQPGDMYSKPLKCGYDPYTCTWAEWSNNPLKQTAIQFYDL